jgi:hypothetical protein
MSDFVPATAKVRVDAAKAARSCKDSITKVSIFLTFFSLWSLCVELTRLTILSCIELFQGRNHQRGKAIKTIFCASISAFLTLIFLPFCLLLPFKFFYHNVLLKMIQSISESCKISEKCLANTVGIPLIEKVEEIQEGEDIAGDEQSLMDYLKIVACDLVDTVFKTLAARFKQTILELSQDEELRENIGKTISQPILEVTRDFVTKLEIVIERARAGLVKDVGEIREDFMKDASQLANEVVEKVDDIAVNTTADITHAATGFTEDLNRVVGRLDGATIVPTNCDGWFGIPRGARVNLGS